MAALQGAWLRSQPRQPKEGLTIVSDSRDLIDKTDALLGRYRGNIKSNPESDFPVLTDIYSPRPLATENSASGVTGTSDIQAANYLDSREVREDLLVDEVLRLLAPHIDAALGDPLRERLDEHLRRALSALTGQVRIDIETLVRVAVSQAVDRALSEKK